MTAEDKQLIATFEAQVRSLICKMDRQRAETDELYAMVDERDERISALKAEVKEWKQRYETLKTARILELSDTDTQRAKSRLNALIREVDLCIAQLKAQD